jgi:hypothetical protein
MNRTLSLSVLFLFFSIATIALALDKTEVQKLPAEYQNLGKQCLKNDDFDCCMYSVINMAEKHYQQAKYITDLSHLDEACPNGMMRNMFKCPSSFQWCEPKGK